jgi:hypothetical protein
MQLSNWQGWTLLVVMSVGLLSAFMIVEVLLQH